VGMRACVHACVHVCMCACVHVCLCACVALGMCALDSARGGARNSARGGARNSARGSAHVDNLDIRQRLQLRPARPTSMTHGGHISRLRISDKEAFDKLVSEKAG